MVCRSRAQLLISGRIQKQLTTWSVISLGVGALSILHIGSVHVSLSLCFCLPFCLRHPRLHRPRSFSARFTFRRCWRRRLDVIERGNIFFFCVLQAGLPRLDLSLGKRHLGAPDRSPQCSLDLPKFALMITQHRRLLTLPCIFRRWQRRHGGVEGRAGYGRGGRALKLDWQL